MPALISHHSTHLAVLAAITIAAELGTVNMPDAASLQRGNAYTALFFAPNVQVAAVRRPWEGVCDPCDFAALRRTVLVEARR